MPTRDHAPLGAPCWIDLWTSDVDGSRRFYSELLGWEALEPSPEFGGYFMFARDGIPTAGGMGDMGEMKAENLWKVYLHTEDLASALTMATARGAEVTVPASDVADLGSQAVLNDSTGAQVGAWQPGSFPGFVVLGEPGTPSWFELATNDHGAAVRFYEEVFHWKTQPVSDTDEFRYTVMTNPEGGDELAGISDASRHLGARGSHWSVYWHVDDVTQTVERAKKLGGAVIDAPADTPYGALATLADPSGAEFKLRTAPQ